ncbi:hypothetical protein [Klugiella xanthotipulae]|uniref:hypothetical protein n=1 Tax=Klugiella xanthotipulae TaxID=244735 RepID=UPI001153505C|nr:hypothetical protein [Klugiella xanthotipulae]
MPEEQVAALYVWQTALGAAWFENLAYTEAILRHSADTALRSWNFARSGSEDWLRTPNSRLASLVKKSAKDAERQADTAKKRRAPDHPRKNSPVGLDDLIAQLSFGSISFLMPADPPTNRQSLRSGYTQRENLWKTGLLGAFPRLTEEAAKRWVVNLPADVPPDVVAGYAVGQALGRLLRLRNRIGHHEQILTVNHSRLRKDMTVLLRAVSPAASDALKRIDRVPRILAMKPISWTPVHVTNESVLS